MPKTKKNKICDKLTFNECELAILRHAVDDADEERGKKVNNSPEVKRIISVVEKFLRDSKSICYGGTAINNILPRQDQFYNKSADIPDYDFYSSDALNNAKKLVDIYIKEGFTEVEAKSGQHHGTYKVFVNFIPVADISYMPKELFNVLKKDAITIDGILYAPPNFLRMGMYLELSRPAGDVSRWEKVAKRLILLNKNYPLKGNQCSEITFQQRMSDTSNSNKIYENVKKTFIDQGCVFFGGYALSLYANYMPKNLKHQLKNIPDFDVLSEDPKLTATILKERLHAANLKNVHIIERGGIGEIIAPNLEIKVGKETVAFIYKPLACHSYNVIKENHLDIRIATIDTMLSFYLAFIYAERPYYDANRILCMAQYLFNVQAKNRLQQKGVLKRFSINCMGHQVTIEEMRAEKAKQFEKLRKQKTSKEYDEWFLRYRPAIGDGDGDGENKGSNSKTRPVTKKKKTKSKTKAKTKKSSSIFF